MALPRSFKYYFLFGEVGSAFFLQIRVGQNIIPIAIGTVFGPKNKMKPTKHPGWFASMIVGFKKFLFK